MGDATGHGLTSAERPVLFTYPGCGYTTDLKRELKREGVEYDEVDLALEPDRIPELLALTNGERLTPVLVNGEDVQIGHNGIGCTF